MYRCSIVLFIIEERDWLISRRRTRVIYTYRHIISISSLILKLSVKIILTTSL
jgi:hypothetical protein